MNPGNSPDGLTGHAAGSLPVLSAPDDAAWTGSRTSGGSPGNIRFSPEPAKFHKKQALLPAARLI